MGFFDFLSTRPKSREDWIKYAYKNLVAVKEAKERLRKIPIEIAAYERKRASQKSQAGFYQGRIESLIKEQQQRNQQIKLAYRKLSGTPDWAKIEAKRQI